MIQGLNLRSEWFLEKQILHSAWLSWPSSMRILVMARFPTPRTTVDSRARPLVQRAVTTFSRSRTQHVQRSAPPPGQLPAVVFLVEILQCAGCEGLPRAEVSSDWPVICKSLGHEPAAWLPIGWPLQGVLVPTRGLSRLEVAHAAPGDMSTFLPFSTT